MTNRLKGMRMLENEDQLARPELHGSHRYPGDAPEDVKGYFADRQVYQHHLERIAEAAELWPDVRRVYAFVRFCPEIAIELDPSDGSTRRRHISLRDWILTEYPALTDFSFFIHGPVERLPRPHLALYSRKND